jgi:hypothetical protein
MFPNVTFGNRAVDQGEYIAILTFVYETGLWLPWPGFGRLTGNYQQHTYGTADRQPVPGCACRWLGE